MLKNILYLFGSSESKTSEITSSNSKSALDSAEQISNESKNIIDLSAQAKLKICQGLEFEKEGRVDKAIASYHQAVNIDPQSSETHIILAKALKKQNQISAAAFHYAQAAKLDISNSALKDTNNFDKLETHTVLPNKSSQENNFALASAKLPKMSQDKLKFGSAFSLERKSQIQINSTEKKVDNLCGQKTMLQNDEKYSLSNQKTQLQNNANSTNGKEGVLETQKNMAIKNWPQEYSNSKQTSLVIQNKSASSLTNNSIAKNKEKPLSLAIENDNGAIVLPTLKTTPSRTKLDLGKLEVARIYLKQALAYGEEQKWEQAIESCQTALKITPDCAEAYKVWGNILQKMNRVAEAIGYYAKAIAIQPDMAEAYANLGSLYAKQKKWTEAVEYYQKSLMLDPNCAGVYRNLAKIWEEFGEEEKALDCLFQALELEPNTLNAEQHFQLAEELAAEGKQDKAIACYRYAIAMNSNFRDAYLKLAKALEIKGEWREAGIYYQEIIRIQDEQDSKIALSQKRYRVSKLLNSSSKVPQNNEVKQLRGQGGINQKLLAQGAASPKEIRDNVRQQRQNSVSKIDLAIQQYLQQAKLEPDSAVIQINLGSLYARKQNWQQASFYYKRAIELDPKSAIGYRNLAKVYGKIGHSDKAANLLFQAYSLESSNISAAEHWQLGEVFQQQNQLQKAISCYRRAIQCQPNYINAYLSLGNILASQNNQEGAISCYKQAIKYDREDYRAYLFLGQIYAREQQWQQAISCYQKTTQLQPNNANALHGLGDALAKQEKWESAVTAYQRAISLNPDFSWSHNNLGDAWLQLNNWQAAANSFQRAISLNPDFAWSHYKLGDALVMLKKWNRAVEAYTRAKELKFDLPDIEAKLAQTVACQMGLNSRQSMSYYQEAIEQNPDNFQLYYKAIEIDGDNAELYIKLANALERQNYHSEAIGFYKIALQMQVDRPEIIQQLKRAKSSL